MTTARTTSTAEADAPVIEMTAFGPRPRSLSRSRRRSRRPPQQRHPPHGKQARASQGN